MKNLNNIDVRSIMMKKINCTKYTTKHYDKCIIKCKNDEECTTSANDKIK